MRPVVYTASRTPVGPGFEQRNPKFFLAAHGKPEDVIVMGDWPAVVAAYEAQGARVHVLPADVTPRLPVDLEPPPAGLLEGAGALPTRESIAKMPKAEVIEWLEAHGVEKPQGPVADLRAKLTGIMFVEVAE